jgi:eukaryotic-like serine/threonine-protein kinase
VRMVNQGSRPAWLPQGIPPELGHYQLIRPLGRGGMGLVFLARHRLLQQTAAIKILSPLLEVTPQLIARFRREMAALGRIPEHPNLVRAQYASEESGVLFLVMDFVDGEDLGKVIRRHQKLPVHVACEIARQALMGLNAIHQVQLVHRDLKPGNLILARSGHVKLLDLGLARVLETTVIQNELTPSNMVMGTFDYQAPEQAFDARAVDIRSDIYSIGCTLFKLITGKVPFSSCVAPADKIRAHASLPFPNLGPDVPEGLDAVLQRMVAKEANDRFRTPVEAAEALQPFTQPETDLSTWVSKQPETIVWPEELDHSTPAMSEGATLAPAPVSTIAYQGSYLSDKRRPWLYMSIALGLVIVAVSFWKIVFAGIPKHQDNVQPFVPPLQLDHQVVSLPMDFLPPGAQPKNYDEMPLFEYHNLLNDPPIEVVWDPANGLATRLFEPKRQLIHVDTPKKALFHLGETHADSYEYQVKFTQASWNPGFGVYFGYRISPDQPTDHKFQFLKFIGRQEPKKEPIIAVVRGHGTVTMMNGRQVYRCFCYDEQRIVPPRQSVIISVEVRNQLLSRILIDGVHALDELIVSSESYMFTPADSQGAFGILAEYTSGKVTQAQFKLNVR